jgi:hypothetical protein
MFIGQFLVKSLSSGRPKFEKRLQMQMREMMETIKTLRNDSG